MVPVGNQSHKFLANSQFLLCFGSDCSGKYLCKAGNWPGSPPTQLQQAQHPSIPAAVTRELSHSPRCQWELVYWMEKKNLWELQDKALDNPVRLKVGHPAERFHFPLTVNEMKAQEDSLTMTAYDGNVVPVQRWPELIRAASCSDEVMSLHRSQYLPWLCETPTCPWHITPSGVFCLFSGQPIDWRGHRERTLLQP